MLVERCIMLVAVFCEMLRCWRCALAAIAYYTMPRKVRDLVKSVVTYLAENITVFGAASKVRCASQRNYTVAVQ